MYGSPRAPSTTISSVMAVVPQSAGSSIVNPRPHSKRPLRRPYRWGDGLLGCRARRCGRPAGRSGKDHRDRRGRDARQRRTSAGEGIDDAVTGIRERHVRGGGPHVAGLLAFAVAREVNVALDAGAADRPVSWPPRRPRSVHTNRSEGRDESSVRYETRRHRRAVVHDLSRRDRQRLLTLGLEYGPDLTFPLLERLIDLDELPCGIYADVSAAGGDRVGPERSVFGRTCGIRRIRVTRLAADAPPHDRWTTHIKGVEPAAGDGRGG